MRRALLLLALAGCGGFMPVDQPGEASVVGCLERSDGSPAAGVPVFLVAAQQAVGEARSGEDGCFALPLSQSGRHTVVANDFRGQGLVEAVRVYGGQRLELGRRTLYPLTLDPALPTFIGVGAAESLGFSSYQVWCGDAQLRAQFRGETTVVDARTGERRVEASAVEARAELGSLTQLRWRDTSEPIALPDGMNCIGALIANPEGFIAAFGVNVSSTGSLCSTSGWLYGARATRRLALVPLAGSLADGPCRLTDDGRCVGWRLGADGVHRTLQTSTEASDALAWSASADETVIDAVVAPASERLTVVANHPSGARVYQQGALVASFDGREAVRLDGTMFPEATFARGRFTSVGLRSTGGAMQWLRIDLTDGACAALDVEAGLLPAPWPSRVMHGDVVAVTRQQHVEPWRWRAEVLEHTGTVVRRRSVDQGPLEQPNYNNASDGTDTWVYNPGFQWLPLADEGLEVVWQAGRLSVLDAGAELNRAKPVATHGAHATPTCAVGRSLLVSGTSVGLEAQLARYDMRRIADELAAAQ